MHNKFIILTTLILFICSTTAFAQRDKKKKKNNDVQIIEFGDDTGDDSDVATSLTGFILKTSPSAFINGWQFFEVEKGFTEFLSLQAGAGFTFKPLLGNLYSELSSELEVGDECDSDQWDNDYCDDYFDLEYRRFKTGLVLSFSPRLFFNDFAPDGSYFGLKMRYSIQNMEVQMVEEGTTSFNRLSDAYQPEVVKRFDLVGHYGYQYLYDKLTAEYFLGLGVRFRNQTRQDLGFDASNNIRNGERTFKNTRLRIEAGLRFGFQL